MKLLLNILSGLGFGRWLDSFSSQMQEMMIEGAGAIEARSELARQEWLEEKNRLQQLAVCAAMCFGLFIGVLICLSIAVMVTFWDTDHRILVVWLIAAFWIVCFLFSLIRIFSVLRKGKESFRYTKQELKEDWKAIKEHL